AGKASRRRCASHRITTTATTRSIGSCRRCTTRRGRSDVTLNSFVDQSVSDLHHAARRLWKTPGFTVVALLTLALGIGVNTAIFTLTEAVLLKPLPVAHPGQIVSLGDAVLNGDTPQLQDSFTLYSYPLFLHLR